MTTQSPWYVNFFDDDYPRIYRSRLSSDNTAHEVDFVERVLVPRPGSRILDLCCGQGRHAVELAKRGHSVVAQDLAESYVDAARNAAHEAGVELEGVCSDMRVIPFESEFDVVINMFTAFGYLESETEDAGVLSAVEKALKPGGKLLLDMLNREWVVNNYVQNEWRREDDGTLYLEHRNLDLLTSRNRVSFTIIGPDGVQRRTTGHDIRLYTLTEIGAMLRAAGLTFRGVLGGYEAEPYAIETRRMIVVAEKLAER